MGDEVDTIGLPIHHQSGELDIGHESEITLHLQQEQAGQLNTLVEAYYGGQIRDDTLRSGLQDLGYSEEQVNTIEQNTQTEAYIRRHNALYREGTDLSPNQLEYLRNNFSDQQLGNLQRTLRTGEGGRLYVLGHGGDQRYYLPDAVGFDVLTEQQRQEADEREGILRDIDIQEGGSGDIIENFTEEQRQRISDITTTYLNSDKTRADLMIFRNNIQRIEGIDRVANIDHILYQYFLDVDYESEYRDEHNGVSQLITEEQFNFMRENQRALHFSGQVIFENPEGIKYYYGRDGVGKVPVPTQEYIENLNRIPHYNTEGDFPDIQLTNDNYNELDNFIRAYMTDNIDETDLDNAVISVSQYDPDSSTRDPYRASAYNIASYYVGIAKEERRYRDMNNGRPSQLSQNQYNFLTNQDLGEYNYTNGLIGIDNDGRAFYYVANNPRRTTILVPTDEDIQGYIDSGVYNPPQPDIEIPEIPDVSLDIPRIDTRPEDLSNLPNPLPPAPIIPPRDPVSLDYPNLPLIPRPVEPPDNIYQVLGSEEVPNLMTDDDDIPNNIREAIEDLRNVVEYNYTKVDVDLVDEELSDAVKEIKTDWGRFVAQTFGGVLGLTQTADRFLEVGGQSISDFLNRRAELRQKFFERESRRTELKEDNEIYREYQQRANQDRETLARLRQEYLSKPKPPKQAGRPSKQIKSTYKEYFTAKQTYDTEVSKFKDLTGEDFNDRYRASGVQGSRMRPLIQKESATMPTLNRKIQFNRDEINRINHKFKFGENPTRIYQAEERAVAEARRQLTTTIKRLEQLPIKTQADRRHLALAKDELSKLPQDLSRFGVAIEELPDPDNRYATGEDMDERFINRFGIVEDVLQVAEGSRKILDMGLKFELGRKLGGEFYDTGIPQAIYNTASMMMGYGDKVDLESEEYQPLTREGLNLPVESTGFIDLTVDKPKELDLTGYKMMKSESLEEEYNNKKSKPKSRVVDYDVIPLPPTEEEDDEAEVFDVPINRDFDTNNEASSVYINDQLPTEEIGDIRIIDPEKRYINTFQNNLKSDLEEDTEIIKNNIENTYENTDEVWNVGELITCNIEECGKPRRNIMKNNSEDNHKYPTFRPVYNLNNGKGQSNLDELVYETTGKYTAEVMKNKGYLFDGKYDKLNKKYKSNYKKEIEEYNYNIII